MEASQLKPKTDSEKDETEEEEEEADIINSLELKNISLSTNNQHNEDCIKQKTVIRNKIWKFMTDKNLVKAYPPSCFDKIPHFKGCGAAADKLSRLREFRRAKCIKINPSLAQMHLRFLSLRYGKTLIVPSPSLNEAFMYKIYPGSLKHFWQFKRASSKAGAKELGNEISLDDDEIKIDLYIVASTVCASNGVRLGKGLGYAEIEWGILYTLGMVNRDTIVATTVHDCQVLSSNELPMSLMCSHDLPVDIIVTPSRIINVSNKLDKPDVGICWDLITAERMETMPILKRMNKKR